MIKRTVKETIREYDDIGRLVRETITETNEDDDNTYTTSHYTYPYTTTPYTTPTVGEYTCNNTNAQQSNM